MKEKLTRSEFDRLQALRKNCQDVWHELFYSGALGFLDSVERNRYRAVMHELEEAITDRIHDDLHCYHSVTKIG